MPPNLASAAKALITFGAVLILAGAALLLAGKFPYLGKLPGDIYIKKDRFQFYFPITTTIIISIALSLILSWLKKK